MEEVDFEKQLKLGQAGEDKVFNYLNNLESTIDVIKFTEHHRFQSYGIDGLLVEDVGEAPPYSFTSFDVKTDYQHHRSGKLFIEIMADTNMNKKGGILSTKAAVFYYYDPYGGHLFKLPIYSIKMWYDRVGISMNHVKRINQHGQTTTGILISPDDLDSEGIQITRDNIGPIQYA